MASLDVKLTGDLTAGLDALAQKVSGEVLLSGVAAMAKVVYDEARLKCPRGSKDHWFYGTHKKYFFPAGTLYNAIYRVYAKSKSTFDRMTYDISWNHQKAPYGFMVEYGTSRAPAHPFMRPAFDQMRAAIDAGNERMRARLAEGGHIPVAHIE